VTLLLLDMVWEVELYLKSRAITRLIHLPASLPAGRLGMNAHLCVGTKWKVERGIPSWRHGRTGVGFSGLGVFPSAQGGSGHAGVNDLWSLRIWYPLQVWAGCLLKSFPTNQIEAGGGHLDRPAGGHGAHKAALPGEACRHP